MWKQQMRVKYHPTNGKDPLWIVIKLQTNKKPNRVSIVFTQTCSFYSELIVFWGSLNISSNVLVHRMKYFGSTMVISHGNILIGLWYWMITIVFACCSKVLGNKEYWRIPRYYVQKYWYWHYIYTTVQKYRVWEIFNGFKNKYLYHHCSSLQCHLILQKSF